MPDDPLHLPIDPDLDPADPAQPAVGRAADPGPRPRSRRAPDVVAAVAMGGMVGASGRHAVAQWLPTAPDGFPWATFWTNLAGSFLLGLLMALLVAHLGPTPRLRPFLATGVLGAFTTMSTFQVETVLLLDHDRPATAALYWVGSLGVGIALAAAGIQAGRRLAPRPRPAT